MSDRTTDDDLHDPLAQAALILLRAADRSWDNVTGEYRSWVDLAIDVPSDDKIFTPRYGTAPLPWAD